MREGVSALSFLMAEAKGGGETVTPYSVFGEIRTMMIDDEPWFLGKDVIDILEYERAGNAIRLHVNNEDKLTP